MYSSNFQYVRIITMCEYYKCNKNVFYEEPYCVISFVYVQ